MGVQNFAQNDKPSRFEAFRLFQPQHSKNNAIHASSIYNHVNHEGWISIHKHNGRVTWVSNDSFKYSSRKYNPLWRPIATGKKFLGGTVSIKLCMISVVPKNFIFIWKCNATKNSYSGFSSKKNEDISQISSKKKNIWKQAL